MSSAHETKKLVVWLNGQRVGELGQKEGGKWRLRYDPEYVEKGGIPLSQSLPLRNEVYSHGEIMPFFDGLLPDEELRERLAKHFGSGDTFKLLERTGRDLAGAISLLPPGEEPNPSPQGQYRRLDPAEFEGFLRNLPEILLQQQGMASSLAGTQPKASVVVRGDMIALPLKGAVSTHIVKPALHEDQHKNTVVENEAFCLTLAKEMGLHVVNVEVKKAGSTPYLLVERYDRYIDQSGAHKLHQEDFCQALNVKPNNRYQSDNGPSIKKMIEILKAGGSFEIDKINLLKSVLFNYFISNSDAHGKNFSIIYGRDGKIHLAPAYDMLCTAVYDEGGHEFRKWNHLSMKIGGENNPKWLNTQHWRKLAEEFEISPKHLGEIANQMISDIVPAAERIAEKFEQKGLNQVSAQIVTHIKRRVSDSGPKFDALCQSTQHTPDIKPQETRGIHVRPLTI